MEPWHITPSAQFCGAPLTPAPHPPRRNGMSNCPCVGRHAPIPWMACPSSTTAPWHGTRPWRLAVYGLLVTVRTSSARAIARTICFLNPLRPDAFRPASPNKALKVSSKRRAGRRADAEGPPAATETWKDEEVLPVVVVGVMRRWAFQVMSPMSQYHSPTRWHTTWGVPDSRCVIPRLRTLDLGVLGSVRRPWLYSGTGRVDARGSDLVHWV